MTSSKIGTNLIFCAENVKFRQSGPGKSPMGVLSAFQDRVEWKQNGATDPLLIVPYSNLRMQKVSAPNKEKVQLQLLFHNNDQATFVFLQPEGREKQVSERDGIKDAIQTALIHFRQVHHEDTDRAKRTQNDALEAKKKFLKENEHLQILYRYLVSSKLISPGDFWSLHNVPVVYKDQLGIPSGFLNSISQTEENNRIHLNLSMDTIRAIFKTYPVVEKKHLELVPHAMNEQEFWAKFFQSHYFHRERDMNEDPNDPFFDCDKNDVKDMLEEKGSLKFRPTIDFNYLLEDLGIVSEIRQNNYGSNRNNEDEEVDRLVRRCNYHSGRLLSTLMEETNKDDTAMEVDVPKVKSHVSYALDLESSELAGTGYTNTQDGGQDVNLRPSDFEQKPREYDPTTAKRFKSTILSLTAETTCTEDFIRRFFDDLIDNPSYVEKQEAYEDFCKTLKSQALDDVKSLYPVTRELLRHFWICVPPKTPEAAEKLERMNETINKFSDMLSMHSSGKISPKHMERLFFMISKAKEKYAEMKQQSTNGITANTPKVIKTVGTKRIEPKLHTCEELISGWKSIVYPTDAVGSRAYAFHGPLADVENALMLLASKIATEMLPTATFIDVDDILPIETTHACGFPLPTETERLLQYTLMEDESKCLSGTAEMGIAEKLKGKTFEQNHLPAIFLARSRCFRPEISTSAAEAKLYRVHEFNKMEMFWVCEPKQSGEVLNRITDVQMRIFDAIELHYRLIEMPSEELGASASKKFDIEAWMPGRGLYGEVSSASNCTDYQSKRLNIRFRRPDRTVDYAHTLNGTVLASTRTMIALLETHQEKGRKGVKWPTELQPFLPTRRSPPIHLAPTKPINYRVV
ncbi:Seryl-tRNA synthetase [Aphelenchoides besseyi]|nr:Seryl-tRNA synthetase [Aphelenchoides besseyi]